MITGPQIKAARRLLGWSVPDLARRAAMNIADAAGTQETAKRPKRRLKDLATDVGIEFIELYWSATAARSKAKQ